MTMGLRPSSPYSLALMRSQLPLRREDVLTGGRQTLLRLQVQQQRLRGSIQHSLQFRRAWLDHHQIAAVRLLDHIVHQPPGKGEGRGQPERAEQGVNTFVTDHLLNAMRNRHVLQCSLLLATLLLAQQLSLILCRHLASQLVGF